MPVHQNHILTLGTLTLGVLTLAGCSNDAASQVPAPPSSGNILDNADILTAAQEQSLNQLIEQRNDETDAARVAIYTYAEDHGDVKDYATEVGNAWGVGDRSQNGVVITVDMNSRKMFIATADDSPISDSDAETIVEEDIQPYFKNDNFEQGLTSATEDLYSTAEGNKPAAIADSQRHENIVGIIAFSLVGLALLGGLLWWLLDRRKWNKIADREIEEALAQDPTLEATDEMRKAYRSYRRNHRKPPQGDTDKYNAEIQQRADEDDQAYTLYATHYAAWLPLYAVAPSLYSGSGVTPTEHQDLSSTSGSSFGGGGGFSGGGAGGSF